MFTSRKFWVVGLFVLAYGLVLSVPLSAQSWESGGFLPEKVRVSFSTGWGLYRMHDLNKHYIDEFAKESDILDDNINGGPSFYGAVSYSLTPRISAGFGVLYVQGLSEKKSWTTVLVVPDGERYATRWEASLAATAVAPQVTVRCHFPFRDLDLFSDVGLGWCWGKSVLKSDTRIPDLGISQSTENRFSAEGFGLMGCLGASHDMSERCAISAEVGYRHIVTGDLEDPMGRPWVVEYGGTGHKMNLDFSGAFVSVSLSVGL